MLETKDLILDKAKFSDWKAMYENVWSHAECAKYMMWRVTESEEAAQIRIGKTIDFQKTHDTYVVYEKKTGEAIGFAGVEQLEEDVFGETGICFGPAYQRKGYGRQTVQCLMDYCREKFSAKTFIYSSREANEASNRLALSMGFKLIGSEEKTDERNGLTYTMLKYSLPL